MNLKSHKLFAFWRYSSYPYVLGGTITKMRDDGFVETVEYGPGRGFNPVKILPLAQGKALMAKIEALRNAQREAVTKLDQEWRKKILAIFPEVS